MPRGRARLPLNSPRSLCTPRRAAYSAPASFTPLVRQPFPGSAAAPPSSTPASPCPRPKRWRHVPPPRGQG